MSRIYIAQKLTFSTLLCFLCRFGPEAVFYYFEANPFWSRKGVQLLLSRRRIAPVPFEQFSGYDPYALITITSKYADYITSKVVDAGLVSIFQPLFGKACPRKISILLNSIASSALGHFAQLMDVVIYFREKGQSVDLLIPYDPFSSHILKHLETDVRAYAQWPLLVLFCFGCVFRKLVFRILSLVRKFSVQTPSVQAVSLQNGEKSKVAEFDVLYFPHKGVLFGQLFLKDHYYSQDFDSPFHSINILHIESSAGVSAEERKNIERYYIVNRCNFVFKDNKLKYFGKNLRLYVLHIVRNVKEFCSLGSFSLTFYAIFIYLAYICFRRDVDYFKTYAKAKIALVGYDYLFSKSMALALQENNIRVVSTQERFIQAFYPSTSYIFDVYFSISDYVETELSRRKFVDIDRYMPIGGMRYDTLYRLIMQKSELRDALGLSHNQNVVLVLDFHSPTSKESNQISPLVNWKNNLAFYQDIDTLASQFPNLLFIIRGKNADWCALEVFHNVHQNLLQRPNVRISTDYSRLNISYELAAISNLVIARHTSLADECLAAGIPVLFHDYSLTTGPIIENIFDYLGLHCFCHNFSELQQNLSRFASQGVLSENQDSTILQTLYGYYFDGKTQTRLAVNLHALLQMA